MAETVPGGRYQGPNGVHDANGNLLESAPGEASEVRAEQHAAAAKGRKVKG